MRGYILYILLYRLSTYAAQWYLSGSMEPWGPGPWSGLQRNMRVDLILYYRIRYSIHYTEKHALLVLFNSTTQTSERLLNGLYRWCYGVLGWSLDLVTL